MKSSPFISAMLSCLTGAYLASTAVATNVQEESVDMSEYTPIELRFGQQSTESYQSTVLVPLTNLRRAIVSEETRTGFERRYWSTILVRGKATLDEEATGIPSSDRTLIGESTDGVRGEMYFTGGPLKAMSIRCVYLNDAKVDSGFGVGVSVSVENDQSFGPEEWQTVPDHAEAVECIAFYVMGRYGWSSGQWMSVA